MATHTPKQKSERVEHIRNLAQILGGISAFLILIFSIYGFWSVLKERRLENTLLAMELLLPSIEEEEPAMAAEGNGNDIIEITYKLRNTGRFPLQVEVLPAQLFDCDGTPMLAFDLIAGDGKVLPRWESKSENYLPAGVPLTSIYPRNVGVIKDIVRKISGYGKAEMNSMHPPRQMIIRSSVLLYQSNHEVFDRFSGRIDLETLAMNPADLEGLTSSRPKVFARLFYDTPVTIGDNSILIDRDGCQIGRARLIQINNQP